MSKAQGYGTITIKENADAESFMDALETMFEDVNTEPGSPTGTTITVTSVDRLYDDDMPAILESFSDITERGCIEFCDDNDNLWRLLFEDGEWREDSGRIMYFSDEEEKYLTNLLDERLVTVADLQDELSLREKGIIESILDELGGQR